MIQITEGTVYGEPYQAVLMPLTESLKDWLIDAFGPEGSMHLSRQRWYYKDFYVWLRDEADLSAFLLRWA
jgi:hypothetical protein